MALNQQMIVAFLFVCLSCTALGSRQLKEESAESGSLAIESATTSSVLAALEHFDAADKAEAEKAKAEHADSRELWVDPTIMPTSRKGWNVIISIIYLGHYTTVNTFALRKAIGDLGFPTDPTKLAFGGQNAMAGYRCVTSFTMNFPNVNSAQEALNAVAPLTVQAVSAKAKLNKGNTILSIFFNAFKPQ